MLLLITGRMVTITIRTEQAAISSKSANYRNHNQTIVSARRVHWVDNREYNIYCECEKAVILCRSCQTVTLLNVTLELVFVSL